MNHEEAPKPVTYISVKLSADMGVDDILVAVRVVPDGREGRTVFGRTLKANEDDRGQGIELRKGDNLVFRPGSIEIRLEDVDKRSPQAQDGYRPVANTIWTWLQTFSPPEPELFRYLFATARRLDTAHSLCEAVAHVSCGPEGETFIHARERWFKALGYAEMACIALNRGLGMATSCQEKSGIELPIPKILVAILPATKAIRNAFEHIDERASGKLRGKDDPDALSIFDQSDLISDGVIRYGKHALSLRSESIETLIQARSYIFAIAAGTAEARPCSEGAVQHPGTGLP